MYQQKYNLKWLLNSTILNHQAKKKKKNTPPEAQENMVDPKEGGILSILSKIKGKKSYLDETLGQTQESASYFLE